MGGRLSVAAVGVAAMTGVIVAGMPGSGRVLAQTGAPAVPKFDVVSIKPCQDPREAQLPGGMYPPAGNSSPGRLRTGCFPLLDDHGMGLIRAFADDPFTPIHGGPSWIHTAFYEIDAVADGSPSVKTMMGPMMQALLEDRFHLKIHHESSEGQVYVLSVARGGPKLHPYVEGSCPVAMQPGQLYCRGLINAGLPTSAASLDDRGITLDGFARQLLAVLDRPVLNQTHIDGQFDIHVEFSREGTKFEDMFHIPPGDGGPRASDPTGLPTIFTAFQEQLGLKLEPGKGPVDVLVLDTVARPSEN